jgi:2-iminobutanoate/2-iminopropanoate deaminase
MYIQEIKTAGAPAAIGPYSQGIRAGSLIFTSGQLPIDPSTGLIPDGDIAVQARQSLLNVRAVLNGAGADLNNVVKTTVFLSDMNDFARFNDAN